MSNYNLLPCPFCGSGARIRIPNTKYFTFYQAVCEECGTSSRMANCPELVVQYWNKRVERTI